MNRTSFSSNSPQSATNSGLETLSRVGFAAKGAVYIVLGVLAVMAAAGAGGQVGGSKDALQKVASQPFGMFLLGALAIGLLCYAIYRLAAAATGKPFENDDKEVFKRIGAAASGIVHIGLAIAAAQILWSGQSSGGGGETWVAKALTVTGGNILIGAIGIGVIIGGLQQAYKAYAEDFVERLKTQQLSRTVKCWLVRLGRFGLAARAVVFPMIGFGLLKVAMTNNPSEYQGLGASLSELSQQSYGNVLLAVVAAGLAAYGVYMLACSKYRKLADEVPS